MRPPRIPPMVSDIVQTALCNFEDMEFITLAACPFCGGPIQGYDTRQKKYATIMEGESERTITVRVRRFTCRNCKRICNADEPFYPDTRIGSLVIDLYLTFASTMPECRAARILDAMGIRVNRTTWKNYSGRLMPELPVTEIFGMRLPSSVITLSNLAARVPERGRITGAEALAACGYPSAYRAGPDRVRAEEGHDEGEEPEQGK
jgi:hypothetical protein